MRFKFGEKQNHILMSEFTNCFGNTNRERRNCVISILMTIVCVGLFLTGIIFCVLNKDVQSSRFFIIGAACIGVGIICMSIFCASCYLTHCCVQRNQYEGVDKDEIISIY